MDHFNSYSSDAKTVTKTTKPVLTSATCKKSSPFLNMTMSEISQVLVLQSKDVSLQVEGNGTTCAVVHQLLS